MATDQEYLERVMVLGAYCYPERAEQAMRLVFSCLKAGFSKTDGRQFGEALPEPLKKEWETVVPVEGADEESDWLVWAMKQGHFAYKAAAERTFAVIFTSIREIVDDRQDKVIRGLLPEFLAAVYESSRTCAPDGCAGDFL